MNFNDHKSKSFQNNLLIKQLLSVDLLVHFITTLAGLK